MNNERKANIIFSKNGKGNLTAKISLSLVWLKELGFSEKNKNAIIKLDNNCIIIKKE